MFNTDNTEGYTQVEIDAINAELSIALADACTDDPEAIEQITKAFADRIARR